MTYKQALAFLDQHVPDTREHKFSGEFGIERMRALAAALGNPQNKLKIIHVAGTSGKGSTATIISKLLQAHDFKVGLTLSPHVYDIRERIQIDNGLISKQEFAAIISKVAAASETLPEKYLPTYFELMLATAFSCFTENKVDYAVVETGMGGLYDGTNIVERTDKLAVISQIGLDHTKILGDTLEKITLQKAGIIQPQNQAFLMAQATIVEKVFARYAYKQNAALKLVNKKDIPEIIQAEKLSLVGEHQQKNLALSLEVVKYLAKRDKFELSADKINACLPEIKLPGRFEIKQVGKKTIILDVAHNPQKLQATTNAIKAYYPNTKFIVLLADKGEPLVSKFKEILQPIAKEIVLTSYRQKQDILQESADKSRPSTKQAIAENWDENDYFLVVGSTFQLTTKLDSQLFHQ